MNKPTVFVTRRWPDVVESHLRSLFDVEINQEDMPLDSHAISRAMKEHDALLPTVTDRIDATVFNGSENRVRIIGNYGVGFSHIDVEAAKAQNIMVTNTPDVLSECTADLAITLMLMVARRAGEGERELRSGQWSGWRPTHMIGQKVSGKTIGIVGFGRIGRETAKRAHFGFGMDVAVYNRSQVSESVLREFGARQITDLDEFLASCDVISLHCPGGMENRHLINAERLSAMKPEAILINTARGEVVDEDALASALKDGAIGGAGLDVYDGEPDINPELLRCPNAVLLPHLGSATATTREAMGMRVISNIVDFFDGNEPQDRVA